jgi:hypothetical protein
MRTALSDKDLETPQAVKTIRGIEVKVEDPDKQKLYEQILKYIPLEVVAFYVPALAALATLKTLYFGTTTPSVTFDIFTWIIFLLAFAGTFYYIYQTATADLKNKNIENKKERAAIKAGISTVAFIIWAITLGGPWSFLVYYEAIGALTIPTFTFLSPIIYDLILIIAVKPKQVLPPPPIPIQSG